jgi:predicted RNase H-like nuclease (RuvC/YqgF family)
MFVQRIAKARQHAVKTSIGEQGQSQQPYSQAQLQIKELKQSVRQHVEIVESVKQQLSAKELELRETKYELSRLKSQLQQAVPSEEPRHRDPNKKIEMKYKQDIHSLRSALEKVEMQGNDFFVLDTAVGRSLWLEHA